MMHPAKGNIADIIGLARQNTQTNLLCVAHAANDLTDVHEHLEVADRELRRASAITNQTLRFHKQSRSVWVQNYLETKQRSFLTSISAYVEDIGIVSIDPHYLVRLI